MVSDDLQDRLDDLEGQASGDSDGWLPCIEMVDPDTGQVVMRIGGCE